MKIKFQAIFFFLFAVALLSGQNNIVTPKADPSLRFTENKGQWDAFIRYRVQLDGGMLYLENDKLTYDFYDKKKYRQMHVRGISKENDGLIKAHAYKVEFAGCNKNSTYQSYEEGTDYENFYLGADKSKWKSNVKNYHRIVYRNIYNGIDYEAITTTQGLKYNFFLKPGAHPNDIKLKYDGVTKMKLVKGELIITTSIDSIIERKPYAYQRINGEIIEIPCKFKLKNNLVSFDFPDGYNKNHELIIDPILVFAAQSGSLADNFGMTATYDNFGNLISGGTAFGNGYPTTVGAYCLTFTGVVPATPWLMYQHGRTDVVLTKYNATGNSLLFSTYLGGDSTEIVTSVIVDASNNVFLYGATNSPNFPTTAGAYDQTFNGGGASISFPQNGTVFRGGTDIYVTKFNPGATALLGSTYVGGSHNDGINYPVGSTSVYDTLMYNYGDQFRGEIQLDKFGNVYIASSTRSSNFPTVNAFDNTLGGYQDAVVFKLNNALTTLIWSSYLGGSMNDAGYSIIVNDSLNAYVTGGTASSDFSLTPGFVGHKTAFSGGQCDGYLVKINPAGNAVLKGTYVGTGSYDQSYFVQNDVANNIYVYGQSMGNMPVVGSVYSNPNRHQFITRYDGQLSNINLSTVFGSNTTQPDISPSAFLVDICGNIYISGWGGNILSGPPITGMPITSGAIYATPPNGYDFYLMALLPNMSSLYYGTYFGGNLSQEHVDGGTSRFNKKGIIYQSVCAGCGGNTSSSVHQDFPVTPGAWPNTPGTPNHNTQNYNCNNGVFKFDFQLKITNVTLTTNTISGCQPLTVNFSNPSYSGGNFIWYFGPGNTNTTTVNPIITFTNAGTYTVSLVVNDTSSCNKKDSAVTFITVYPKVTVNATATLVPCSDTVLYSGNAVTAGTLSAFQWTFSGGSISTSTLNNPVNTYSSTGSYTAQLLAVNNFGCRDSVKVPVTLSVVIPSIAGDTICNGSSGTVIAGGGTSYLWQPSTGLSSITVANPTANPTVTTTYSATITNTLTGCVRTLTTLVVVRPKPVANFSYTVNPCGGGVQFADQSVSGITQWNWNLGNSQTSGAQNPYQFYPAGGSFSVSLIVANNYGCKDTIVQPLTVGVPPPVSISATQTICIGNYASLNATGGFAYQWTPTTGLSNPNFQSPIATPTTSTQYSVTISTINSLGDTCKLVLNTSIIVAQLSTIPLAVGANPDTVIKGNSTVLTLTASAGANATWFPSGSTVPANGYTVNATPLHPTTYTVVVTRGPCSQTLTVRVEVIDDGCEISDVYVPNTFTPNGDGYNDVMYARGYKLGEIYFAIYNRWGEMVFETNDKNIGWDGIYKGKPADVGVFGYYIKVKCYNGLETFKKGNITLIR